MLELGLGLGLEKFFVFDSKSLAGVRGRGRVLVTLCDVGQTGTVAPPCLRYCRMPTRWWGCGCNVRAGIHGGDGYCLRVLMVTMDTEWFADQSLRNIYGHPIKTLHRPLRRNV